MSDNTKRYPVVSKEVVDKVFSSESGWTTVYEGPTVRMAKTVVLHNPIDYVSVELTVPEFSVEPEATGSDSIRAGIDAEALEEMTRKALAMEDAAIVDDLKRQVNAGCVMPQIYVPLQVSHIFKKEENDK